MDYQLNQRAYRLVQAARRRSGRLRVQAHELASGTVVLDCGVQARGGIEAGLLAARVCLADLAEVSLVPGRLGSQPHPYVQVVTDHPVAACLASQYAGWQVAVGDYRAMGSGPMRAAAGDEELYERIGCRERPSVAVGLLEAAALPDESVARFIAERVGVPADALALLVAPTASRAAAVQIVARSVETALHKLDTLGFDLWCIQSGWGTAPLPPPSSDSLAAMGRANDAVLYGASVTLWCRGPAALAAIQEFGPQVPSAASTDYGRPFAELFEQAGRNFYRIDPHLFSPAWVTFHDQDSGRTFRYGSVNESVLLQSFGLEQTGSGPCGSSC